MGHPYLEVLGGGFCFQGRNPSASSCLALITKLPSVALYPVYAWSAYVVLSGPYSCLGIGRRAQWAGGNSTLATFRFFLLIPPVPKEPAVCFNPTFQGWVHSYPSTWPYPVPLCLSSVLFHCSLRKWTKCAYLGTGEMTQAGKS